MLAQITALIPVVAAHGGADFRKILPYTLLAALVLIVLHLIIFRSGREAAGRLNLWDKLIYLLALGSVAVLGVTSFGAMMRFGVLEGWPLFTHMFGAGAFVTMLPLWALTWCGANRFGGLPRSQQAQDATPRFFWFSKLMYWIIIAGGLVVTMTMLLSMLPLYGTDGLQYLLDIHRWSGLVVVVAAMLHFYSVVRRRIGKRD
jgi:hypothetical protein